MRLGIDYTMFLHKPPYGHPLNSPLPYPGELSSSRPEFVCPEGHSSICSHPDLQDKWLTLGAKCSDRILQTICVIHLSSEPPCSSLCMDVKKRGGRRLIHRESSYHLGDHIVLQSCKPTALLALLANCSWVSAVHHLESRGPLHLLWDPTPELFFHALFVPAPC